MAADGHIILQTKVDQTGVKTGMNNIKNSFKALGGMLATALSVTAVKNFANETKALYQTQMENELKLSVILKQRAKATDEQVKSVLALTSAQQKLGVIGDEVQIAGAQQLSTFLTNTDAVKELIPAMNNLLAQQKGLNATTGDAVNIANMMGKVFTGQTSALRRVGISMSDYEEEVLKSGTEMQKAAMLAQVITNNVGNMNAALAQTDSGKQQQLANRLGDVKEKLGGLVMIIQSAFLPAIENILALVEKVTGKLGTSNNDTMAISNNVQDTVSNQNDLTEAVEETQKAQNKSLAGFDEINQITKDTAEAATTDGAVGDTLGSLGVTPSEADTQETPNKVAEMLGTILTIVGGAMLALGLILLTTGNIGLGLGFILLGIGVLGVSAVALNYNEMSDKTKMVLTTITAIAGGALLALGIILVCTGVGIPLGIGMIVSGAASLATAIAVNWDWLTEKMKGTLGAIMAIVGAAALVIGIILVCTGVGIPLGIGLILSGAAALGTAIAFNWNAIVDKVKDIGSKIKKVFLDVWDGIKKGFKAMVNGIIWFANLWIDGLNLILLPIRGLILGISKAFGKDVTLKDIAIPHIPKLAKGAVLPANKPFLAQLGDQKNGRNLEAPESLLREIYAEGNAETNALLQQLIQVMQKGMTVNVDGQQLMRINRDAETRSGRQTVTGGFANAY